MASTKAGNISKPTALPRRVGARITAIGRASLRRAVPERVSGADGIERYAPGPPSGSGHGSGDRVGVRCELIHAAFARDLAGVREAHP